MMWTFTFSFLKTLAVMYPWYSWSRATRILFRIGPPRWNGGLGWGKFYPWCQDTPTLSIFQVVHMQAMFYMHISTSFFLVRESHQTQHDFCGRSLKKGQFLWTWCIMRNNEELIQQTNTTIILAEMCAGCGEQLATWHPVEQLSNKVEQGWPCSIALHVAIHRSRSILDSGMRSFWRLLWGWKRVTN